MRVTLDDLIVPFGHVGGAELVADWRWLIGSSKHPVLVSAIGDAFVQDEREGPVHLLDTAAGTCSQVADDANQLRQLLSDSGWVTEHLAVEFVAGFLTNDLRLSPGEVYTWKHPPALGGEFALENAATCDMVVHFSTTGQIHEQIRDLPAGTPIDRIEIRDPE